jgi:hypothetical protein
MEDWPPASTFKGRDGGGGAFHDIIKVSFVWHVVGVVGFFVNCISRVVCRAHTVGAVDALPHCVRSPHLTYVGGVGR